MSDAAVTLMTLLAIEGAGASAKLAIDMSEPPFNRPPYTRKLLARWLYPLAWPVVEPLALIHAFRRNSARWRQIQAAMFLIINGAATAAGLITYGVGCATSAFIGLIVGVICAAAITAVTMIPFKRTRAERSLFR